MPSRGANVTWCDMPFRVHLEVGGHGWVAHTCVRVTSHGPITHYNAVVTPVRKATSYEPRIAVLGMWGDTWLTRGKYGIYMAVRGSYVALTGST